MELINVNLDHLPNKQCLLSLYSMLRTVLGEKKHIQTDTHFNSLLRKWETKVKVRQ